MEIHFNVKLQISVSVFHLLKIHLMMIYKDRDMRDTI
jgi:hypothetical protein